MWLHVKYTRESFAVDAELIWGGCFFGVEWVFISQQVERIYCVSKQLNKNEKKSTSCGYRRENLQKCCKTKQGGGCFVKLMVEISKQQRQTARAKSCCPKGKDGEG